MFCAKMHLTERKFRIESTINQHKFENSISLSIDNRMPFVRPCTIIKMYGEFESADCDVGTPLNQCHTTTMKTVNVLSSKSNNVMGLGTNKTDSARIHRNINR